MRCVFSILNLATDSICEKALEDAKRVYSKKIPNLYTSEEHEERMTRAMAILKSKARGSLRDEYSGLLETYCASVWNSGRRQCAAKSLHGFCCVLKSGHPDNHKSNFMCSDFCLCGNTQTSHPDAFLGCNESVALSMESCCSRYELVKVPAAAKVMRLGNDEDFDTTIRQPGFIGDTNNLCVKYLTNGSKKDKVRRNFSSAISLSYGIEYICPKGGHRFLVTEGDDYPLRRPCLCNIELVAELSRLFIKFPAACSLSIVSSCQHTLSRS